MKRLLIVVLMTVSLLAPAQNIVHLGRYAAANAAGYALMEQWLLSSLK